MASARKSALAWAILALGFAALEVRAAENLETLVPYKMLRSLQFVQDTVVLGDHSAAEMQRFMLETVDERLRGAEPSVFDEVRNVDAALIYAMSGGNPSTLEYLMARDINGNFDTRVSDGLRKYLSGKGVLIARSLGEMATEYRNSRIGPYLALVAGNVSVTTDPATALKHYDWARLTAPGTIVEEAALRRSFAVAIDAKMIDKALRYSQSYARRFLYSPYASQFADLFVQLAVDHYEQVSEIDIMATLGFMDSQRQREVYLRIARKAAIDGKNDLARLAADKAKSLDGEPNDNLGALADLYGGVAAISTADVGKVVETISDIPDEMLTPADRALRQAAEAIAREVLRAPDPESLAQDRSANSEMINDPVGEEAAPDTSARDAAAKQATDPGFRSFVDNGRSKIDEIDSLLQEEGTQ